MPLSLSETARERELFRYFQPDLDTTVHLHKEALHDRKGSSHDVSLTAFAQLGAFRMNASRGFVTLSSRTKHYIVAESAKSLSLQDDSRHSEEDGFILGAGEKAADDLSFTPTIMDRLVRPSTDPLSLPYFFVGDLTKDDRFKTKFLVTGYPFVRSVVSYPIRTPTGYVIGTYMIMSTVTRDTPTEEELQFLKDMATTIMDHIKSISLKKKNNRAERMVKALTFFIEGKSSLRDWWISQEGQNIKLPKLDGQIPESSNIEHAADIEFGKQDPPDSWMQGLENARTRVYSLESPSSIPAALNNYEFGRPPATRLSTNSSATTAEQSTTTSVDPSSFDTVLERRWTAASTPTVGTAHESGSSTPHIVLDSNRNTESFDATSGKKLQEALVSTDMKSAFSRAANLVREAINLDGAIFYESDVGSMNSSSQRSTGAPPEMAMNGVSETSSDDDFRRKDCMAQSSFLSAPSEHPTPEKTCSVLGYSTRTRSSLNNHAPIDDLRSLPQSLLHRLLKRYPKGKVFNFDEDGAISASESDGYTSSEGPTQHTDIHHPRRDLNHANDHSRRKRMSHRQEAECIATALPGVRSAVFFPLWDPAKEIWIAGSFIWSASPMRVLCPHEDISYIAAFGNNIIAELTRISAILSAQMKVDFTSSISHELRSPLHGVLASVEFLEDTTMTEMQADMVNTIHACGNTLLDTINHVLDFSKVNRKFKDRSRVKRKTIRSARDSSRSRQISKVQNGLANVENIFVLAEEVIESVYAGHRVKNFLPSSAAPHRLSSGSTPALLTPETPKPPITVIVDIAWRKNWQFDLDAGAWRRILMNIFGNSMKYTDHGFVHISIQVDEETKSKDGTPEPSLLLSVRDSGKGISDEFLKTQLYKPFTQEDGLASGTGLGLSIVREIVRSLGGGIHYTSEKGVGTEARVTVPLNKLKGADAVEETTPDAILQARKATQGLKACLMAFDVLPNIGDEPTGILPPEAEAIMCLRSSISMICADWLGMEISPSPAHNSEADIILLLEAGIRSDQSFGDVIRTIDSGSSKPKTVLVLCNSFEATIHSIHKLDKVQVFYITQPYGPLKLAHGLYRALTQPPDPLQSYFPPATPKVMKENRKVTIRAPPVKKEPVPQFGDAPANAALNGAELKILLVEDNEINLKLLVAYMDKLKIPHETAINGLEALHKYQAARGAFNFIFMDISMPVMDGLEASREIREHEKHENLPATIIIALTGAASIKSKQEAFRSGVDLFLTKPVPMKKLKGILQDLRNKELD
ncbi:hypothetical protein BP6252_11040 [Coleophoma cylindrospora]|uniref:histidine kinase n=1 Tax=Coleophoma cylindrospora TaxID=1849047 RepID=A0A3D8QNW4_9HELO|nr:hypothetical protein BP6252_11040 [Coleophoma cylindrospora]